MFLHSMKADIFIMTLVYFAALPLRRTSVPTTLRTHFEFEH